MKDILIILKRNFTTPIFIAILILASILLYLGEYRDAWFISSIVFLNTILAIIQETRARNELRKLEILCAPHARRLKKDGTTEQVMFDVLVVGDQVELQLGDEVPADGIIISSSGLETDESILTGESASVEKLNKSTVYAASGVVAGKGIMQVTAIGVDTKAGKMASVLKHYEPEITPVQREIAKAITYLTYGALGLATLILVVYYLSGQDAVKIFKAITASAITIVPEGLLLASTLLLAYGSIRLAQAKVLPQKLSSIEAMALLNILCVDKTGTLTSDKIIFEKLEIFGNPKAPIADLVGMIAKETSSGSKTGNAIMVGVPAPLHYVVLKTLAFSSSRKMSGVKVRYDDEVYSILMGAPEYLSKLSKLTDEQRNKIKEQTICGKRVLLVVLFKNTEIPLKDLADKSGQAVGIVVLTNELRHSVGNTIEYFQDSGVSIRVISGDNPDTVKYVAKQAGIKNSNKVLTGAELSLISDNDWDEKISKTTIFARVLPEQKERIIDTFKKLGYFTGMVGDGINDALAIKKSNLGVAMFDGAVATRRVADIVLLNNSFNSLPLGMKLGNKIMQAIEIIATLFFHKLSYSIVLILTTLSIGMVYPFAPRHITFMNIFLVTLPTIMWTLFTPVPTHRVSPKHFWNDTLFAVMPIAAISGIVVTVSYAFLNSIHTNDQQGVATTTVIIATFFGIYLVYLVPRMFNIKHTRKSRFARILYSLSVVFVVLVSFGIGFIRDFFDFKAPAWQNTLPLFILIIFAAIFQWKIATNAGKRLHKREHNEKISV